MDIWMQINKNRSYLNHVHVYEEKQKAGQQYGMKRVSHPLI